jgi:hypothetical protein
MSVCHYKWWREEGSSLRGRPASTMPPPPAKKKFGRDLLVNEIFTKIQALLTAPACKGNYEWRFKSCFIRHHSYVGSVPIGHWLEYRV